MKVNIFNKILLVVLILNACLVNMNSLAYAATNKQGVDVIMVIDTSGSMGLPDRDPKKRALSMADFFVRNLPDDDLRLGVYSFSTEVHEVFAFGEVRSEKSDKVMIHNDIKELKYSGDTDMGYALEKCANIWDKIKQDSASRKQIIVFMTDGEISFGNDSTESELQLINKSKGRMNDALKRIDCTACPIYVIAFGEEAVEGEDAKKIASREGNRFIPARNQATLLDAYKNVFENILGTKKVEKTSITIDKENTTIDLNNDDIQTGLNVNITKNPKGTGDLLDDEITIVNNKTDQIWTKEDFEDYYDDYLGRLIKIPEELLSSGPLSIVFKTASSDVIDINEYYLYDISCNWNTENGKSYERGQEITFEIAVDGIDPNSFVVYAIFEKVGNKGQQTIPDRIYSGQQVNDVKIYGSSLDVDKLETFSGVKMLLDTQDNVYQTTVAFENAGDYQIHIYGESEKGFTQSEDLEFSINKSSDNANWKDKLKDYLRLLWKMFLGLPFWGKGIAIIVAIYFIKIIIKMILSLFYRKVDKDEVEEEEEEEG